MEMYGAGSSSPVIAALSTWVLVPAEDPPGDAVGRRPEEGSDVEVLFERVAGLDIGEAILTVCERTPDPRGSRSATRTFSTMSRSLEVLGD